LAGIAGVSRRAIQLYEEGAGAEITIVERMEAFLGEPLVSPITIFDSPRAIPRTPAGKADEPETSERRRPATEHPPSRTGDPLRDGVLDELNEMGLEVTVTVRASFDAFSRAPEILLTGVGSLRTALHRAQILAGLARVAEGHAMFIVAETIHRPSIGGVPILNVRELRRHRDPDELMGELTEREGP